MFAIPHLASLNAQAGIAERNRIVDYASGRNYLEILTVKIILQRIDYKRILSRPYRGIALLFLRLIIFKG